MCPEGSFRARYLGGLLACCVIDISLFGIWFGIKYYYSHNKVHPPSFSSESKASRGKEADHIGIDLSPIHPGGNRGVVSHELVEGFARARGSGVADGAGDKNAISLLFEFQDLSVRLPSGLNILQSVSGSIQPVCINLLPSSLL